jgi:outer membrane lipoprotein SlyB
VTDAGHRLGTMDAMAGTVLGMILGTAPGTIRGMTPGTMMATMAGRRLGAMVGMVLTIARGVIMAITDGTHLYFIMGVGDTMSSTPSRPALTIITAEITLAMVHAA